MTEIQEKILAIIKEEMSIQDVSIYRLCKDAKMDITGVSNILKRDNGASMKTLQKIIDYLGINLDINKYEHKDK